MKRRICGAVVVFALAAAGVECASSPTDRAHETGPPSSGDTGRLGSPGLTGVRDDTLPGLADGPPQRDVSAADPAVKAYTREHRLVAQLPLTDGGVTFDVAGREGRRVVVVANANGLPRGVARAAFRRILRRFEDPARSYRLRLAPPIREVPR